MKRLLLTTLLLYAATELGPQIQAATLVSQWSFEGNANDTSGNGNNGTVVSGSPTYAPGKFGQGIYINSKTDHIANTAAVGLPVAATASWSYNVWLYLTSAPDSLGYFCGFGCVDGNHSGQNRGLIAYGGSGNNGIYAWAANNDLASGAAYPLDAWSMVTVTHDGITGTTTIWLNGSSIASGFQGLVSGPNELHVGGAPWNWAGFQGIVDEFTVWSGVLTADDIAGLYASNTLPPQPPSIATAPVSTSGYEGEYVSLSVVAGGTGPFTYQWYKTGTGAVSGATNDTLVLGPLSPSDNATSYTVEVINTTGNVTSAPATVSVLSVPNIATGLAAYWPFDEDTTDESKVADVTGKGNDGMRAYWDGTQATTVTDSAEWVPGKIGTALHFRGPGTGTSYNDYVVVADNNLQPASTLTIAAWVWADSLTYWGSILKNWPNDKSEEQFHLGLQWSDGDVSCLVEGQSGVQSFAREGASNPLPVGQWIHVAMVCNGQTLQLYRNGAPSGAPVAYSAPLNPNLETMYTLAMGAKIDMMGQPDATVPGYWQGNMDDMGVWTRGLRPSEIAAIYLAGQAGQPLTNADAYTNQQAPLITFAPASATVMETANVNFNAAAIGTAPLSYQWYKNDTAIVGETNTAISITDVALFDAGNYTVVVTNSFGSATSAPAATLTVNPQPLPGPITNGLMCWWKLSDGAGTSALDSVGGYNGMLLNYPDDNSQWVTGMVGGALAFVKASFQAVNVPNYPKPATTMTAAAWVWVNNTANNWGSFLKNWSDSTAGQFHFGLDSGGNDLDLYIQQADNNIVHVGESATFPRGSWQHVAFVCDGSFVRLYRNGTEVASASYNGTLITDTAMSCLGIGGKLFNDCSGVLTDAWNAGCLDGMIQDVGLWNRALQGIEIQELYGSGLSGGNIGRASISPLLQGQLQGVGGIFRWPLLPLGRSFVLEATPSLSAPAWQSVGVTPTVIDGWCTLTLTPPNGVQSMFFRLHR